MAAGSPGSSDLHPARGYASIALLEAAALAIAALAIRLVRLDTPPFIDELYHVLAAQSWLQDGTLIIGEGDPYTRARPYTMLVAMLFRWWGEGLAQARIPSVVAGALLVAALFLWVRRAAGRGPAWIAGGLLALDAHSIALSQIGRFYTLHALLIWMAAIALYALRVHAPAAGRAKQGRMRTAVLVGAAVIFFAAARNLHGLSDIPIGLLLMWLVLDAAGSWANWLRLNPWRGCIAAVIAIAALLALLFAVDVPSLIGQYVNRLRLAPLWAAHNADNWLYYHRIFQEQYGPLWTLVPVITAAAFLWKPRPTLFLAWLFFTSLVVQSLAAQKEPRYLAYAMPAYFALCGIGLGRLAVLAYESFLGGAEQAFGPSASRHATLVAFVVVALATFLLALDANKAAPYTFRILTAGAPDRPPPYPRGDWEAAQIVLRPIAREADVVVSSSDLKALYYLDRLDYELSANALSGFPEFTRSWQTGKPAIRSASALARVLDCHSSGLIVMDWDHVRNPAFVRRDTMDWIETHAEQIPLDDRIHVRAFLWHNTSSSDVGPDACPPN